eukprot:TRINITY_DN2658_c0_g1_i1.p1 TRINITY_DN2658_c0_g1~~TRINITY_DN2658_c0_g1_i1.p1  ORF type:complete len:337 (-),score=61.45 TRINITY_DN2658_c0_g1_i1:34-1044(-)
MNHFHNTPAGAISSNIMAAVQAPGVGVPIGHPNALAMGLPMGRPNVLPSIHTLLTPPQSPSGGSSSHSTSTSSSHTQPSSSSASAIHININGSSSSSSSSSVQSAPNPSISSSLSSPSASPQVPTLHPQVSHPSPSLGLLSSQPPPALPAAGTSILTSPGLNMQAQGALIPQSSSSYSTSSEMDNMLYAQHLQAFSQSSHLALASQPTHHIYPGGIDKKQITFVEFKPPSYKRAKPGWEGETQYFCYQCGSKSSPEWRRGPEGPKTLCNACGIRFAKRHNPERKDSPPKGSPPILSIHALNPHIPPSTEEGSPLPMPLPRSPKDQAAPEQTDQQRQ